MKQELDKFIKLKFYEIRKRVETGHPKPHLYLGLPIMSFEEFVRFSVSSNLIELYKNWLLSGKLRKFVPSVDRIDSSKGYTIGNVRWVTLSENSRNIKNYNRKRLPENKYRGVRRTKSGKWEARVHLNYKYISLGYFDDIEEAKKIHDNYIKTHSKAA